AMTGATAAVVAPALALDLALAPPRERDGLVVIEGRPARVLDSRVAESLERGMPATLVLHAELWRDRRGWFDRLESSADASVRIRYDVWTDSFLLERIGAAPIIVGSVDSVATVLQRPWVMAVGRVGQLTTRSRYYVVLTGTLRPLTVEDLEEVEGWLSGEVGGGRRSGFGIVAEIPRSVFEAVRNVAGFGDQKARAISATFGLRDLFPQR
ncbi:MAG: DUF4390 domain-containing protein, partial [Candidatus Eiseniibacteriota bacterium]